MMIYQSSVLEVFSRVLFSPWGRRCPVALPSLPPMALAAHSSLWSCAPEVNWEAWVPGANPPQLSWHTFGPALSFCKQRLSFWHCPWPGSELFSDPLGPSALVTVMTRKVATPMWQVVLLSWVTALGTVPWWGCPRQTGTGQKRVDLSIQPLGLWGHFQHDRAKEAWILAKHREFSHS